MKRVQLLEFEDLAWFPSWLRTCMTNNIVIMARFLGVGHALSLLISEALKTRQISHIVDLGSGSGGVLPDVLPEVRRQTGRDVSLLLSDKYPNRDAIRNFNERGAEPIRYCETPVDATNLETAPSGLKTMVNCFHHMSPPEARAILASAVTGREPLLIYEMAGHQTVPFGLWLLTLPIGLSLVFFMAFVKSAFVRPFTLKQLVFTYLIPVIPIFYAWDGQASMPRIYRMEDLDELLSGLEDPGYTWKKGHGLSRKGAKLGTYLLGLPVELGDSVDSEVA